MAQKDNSVKSFTGSRISSKQMKIYLAGAKSGTERAAIKKFCLGEPLKVFAKEAAPTDAADKIDELISK